MESERTMERLSTYSSLPGTISSGELVALFKTEPSGIFAVLNKHATHGTSRGVPLAPRLIAACRDAQRHILRPSMRKTPPYPAAEWRYLFVVQHSFGDVTYNSKEFANKNLQRISRTFAAIMGSSKNTVLRAAGATVEGLTSAQVEADKLKRDSKTSEAETAVTVAQRDATALIDVLKSTGKHFLVCIKPTEILQEEGGVVNSDFVLRQIRLHRVVDLVIATRWIHSRRTTHREFFGRYMYVSGDADHRKRSLASFLNSLLGIGVLDKEQCIVDRETIYLTTRQVSKLEKFRPPHRNACTTILQRNLIAMLRRKRYSPLLAEMCALIRAMTSSTDLGDPSRLVHQHLVVCARIVGPPAAQEIRVLAEAKRITFEENRDSRMRNPDSVADAVGMTDAP